MNRKTALVAALLITALGAGACASAGSGGGSDVPDDWTGPTPSENEWTTEASLYLVQALQAESETDRESLGQQALAAAEAGIENDAENPQVWMVAGQSYVVLEDYAMADSMFDRAIDLYPHYDQIEAERSDGWVMAYNNGVDALNAGDQEEAREYFEGAARLWDGRPAAHLQAGALAAQAGETDHAVMRFREAIEIIRGPAAEATDSAVTADWPEYERIATLNAGQILVSDDRNEEAAEIYGNYAERHPDDLGMRINLAVALSRAGEHEEASAIYDELLSQRDLPAQTYVTAGIGLFQAERYEEAADAFEEAVRLNPRMRDALYNAAQTYYSQALDLESARDSAETTAERDEFAAELEPLYERTLEYVEDVREMDPFNRNVLALQGTALRGMADIAPDSASATEWRRRALQIFETHEELPFDVTGVNLDATEGQVTISGSLTNLSLDPGQTIRLQFTLMDESGATLATPTATVAAPEESAATTFQTTAEVDAEVAAWRYERVN
ncbi:MAG: tetratricopeptide repeat protein [Gemmatimonadota bacterium]